MLLQMAIGDAYGSRFEGDRDPGARNSVEGYGSAARRPAVIGRYTDDTQMSVAIAEALVEGDPWTPDALAQRIVTAYRRDPRRGYARGFRAFLDSVTDGAEFLARIRPRSQRSGAAMRAAPLGVLPDISEIVHRSRIQAAITHDTPGGIASATAAALMSHYFLYGLGPKRELGTFLERHVQGNWAEPWSGRVDMSGVSCVRAAVTAFTAAGSMRDLLRTCIAWTGDVDTVAAIALAAAAGSPEIARDLPPALVDNLESGPYGRDYITKLDARLHQLVGRP
jgi:ADP-ribosyl-[dinitrogen reductase] hydrolase